MTAKWLFERKRRNQKSRDPMQASFFTNSSIDDDTHALVREAIQNSMDAKSNLEPEKPVYVRFSLGSHDASTGIMDRYISKEAWQHFNADDNGLTNPPTASENCRFLVYEDFNTNGLIGDITADEAQVDNSFYFFMRAEGQSGKQAGERGRHGIGKYVFPYTSAIRMFIALTVRSSDGRCLIAGQSVLKSHHVAGIKFTPDGWWGKFDHEDFQLPIEDLSLFEQLANDFSLVRTPKKTGLSLIMPYVQPEVTAHKLLEHVIREFFWPIMNCQLIVEIVDNKEEYILDNKKINVILDSISHHEQIEQISPYIKLASTAITKNSYQTIELQLPISPSQPKWDKNYLPKDTAKKIHDILSEPNGFIRIRCNLYVKPENAKEATGSHFDMYLSKDVTDSMRKPQFLREGILIPESRVQKVRGYTSIIVIEAGALATLLGDAENPAHTEWEKNATKFKGKYRWGTTTIDFVRLSVSKLMNLMSQGDEDEDINILSDIFYLEMLENDDDVPDSRKRAARIKPKMKPKSPPEHTSIPRTHSYQLIKSEDGFIVQGTAEPLKQKRRYLVKVAYDFEGASKANALKQWHKNDFHLGQAKYVCAPKHENISNVIIGGNSVEFEANSNNFRLSVHGFDRRRDIVVDVDSKVVLDEEI